jgi:hypothetical protein
MKYRKEDLPKIIVLVIILVAVVIYIGVAYSRGMRKMHAQLEAAHRQLHAAQGAQQRNPQQDRLASTLASVVAQVPPPTRDPFDPIIPPRNVMGAQAARPSAGRPASRPSSGQTMAMLPTLPPLGGSETSAGTPASRDTLQLTGVIVGPPSLVVMRRGEEHYILHQGDVVEGTNLRVNAVTRDSVTLRDGRASYTLRLGG